MIIELEDEMLEKKKGMSRSVSLSREKNLQLGIK
jgi:hypothetical protein